MPLGAILMPPESILVNFTWISDEFILELVRISDELMTDLNFFFDALSGWIAAGPPT